MNILITGGNGYIAKSLTSELKKHHKVTTVTRSDFDIADSKQTNDWFQDKYFDTLIHTAVMGGSRLQADDSNILETNLRMHYNLVSNRDRFQQLISFGSGAEIFAPDTPYGLSKRVIANSIREISDWHNIRIFGVFDENELPTRFIKANIKRYLQKTPMIIHTDKVMDFFYMDDLIELVKFYTTEKTPPKTINCSYEQKYTLSNITDIINSLGQHKVPVTVENKNKLEFYCGESHNMPIKTIGLERGIHKVYNSLLNGDLIK